MSGQQAKAKGVVDMVFLLDVTASMQPCIDALKANINLFIESLTTKDQNNPSPVRDWRAKAVGFRDFEEDTEPFVDNPFVRSPADLSGQLARLHAVGGGDLPESLLDAIYKVATMEQTAKEAQEVATKWRYRSAAARVVIVFTDAEFKDRLAIPEAKGGDIQDVFNVVQNNRIILCIFAPDLPCYDTLSQLDKSEYEAIPFDPNDPSGPQRALEQYTSNQENFKNTLKQLAKSVSKSAETPEL